MTSRERVLKAFHHEIPDRVPVDFSYNQDIYNRLIKHYKAKDHEELLKALQVDFRFLWPRYTGKPLHFAKRPDRNVDPIWGFTTRWIENDSGGYWDYCDFPLEFAEVEEIKAFPVPNPDDFDYDTALEYAKANKDMALAIGGDGNACVINSNGFLRGMEQTLIDLATDDEAGLLLAKRRTDAEFGIMERLLDKCGDYITVMRMGEDLGTQRGQFISDELYIKHIMPIHKKFVDLAKSYGKDVMMHCCGSSSWAFKYFIDMGITVIDTLQPEAANMEPAYIKKTYGDKLAFHGCISTAGPLAYGTADDVEKNVKETLEIMMPGGGYCLSPTHQIQDNSPTENVVRMYECVNKYGYYK